ncbi:MAG: type II secretion system F family protein [Oligoflexia bacterium]|nr:type II secretion system F family protein [Oligoflexia bacterium]MBF0364366.1 type II secretion system F family protein [Oligoflexia bacterium]
MMLYYASIILIGVAAFILANAFTSSEEVFKTSEKLDEVGKSNKKNVGAILQYSRPFFKRYVSPIVATFKNKHVFRQKYKKLLANAGLTEELTPDDFYAFKLFLILGFPILFVCVREAGTFYDWDLRLAPLMGIFGFFYPDIWIRGKIQQRQEDVISGMPFVVDMLALSVEAGLDFMAAMSKVIEKSPPNALVEELVVVLKDTKVGSSRAEALRGLAWRTNVIQMSSFCATLIAADSVGASIGPILKLLSNDIRQKRSSMIEKAAAKAATKILFPMMAFIIPSVFIVIASPIALDAMRSQ